MLKQLFTKQVLITSISIHRFFNYFNFCSNLLTGVELEFLLKELMANFCDGTQLKEVTVEPGHDNLSL